MIQLDKQLFTAKAANGASDTVMLADYAKYIVTVYTTGTTTATIKFAVSDGATQADFTNAASATNVYDYVQLVSTDTGTATNGSTGIALIGSDIVKRYTLNSDAIGHLACIVSGYSAGSINVKITAYNQTK